MEILNTDIERVLRKVEVELGADPAGWAQWPGGWPDDIEAALIDAIYSARATYLTTYGKGIQPLVVAWRSKRERKTPMLGDLVAEIDKEGPTAWAMDFGNSQTSPGRPNTAPGGASKAAAIREAAVALIDEVGVTEAGDITEENAEKVRAALRRVKGIGPATVNYFLMLLNRPGVKPDRMVHRFLDGNYTDAEAVTIVSEVAKTLAVPEHHLDHAIWAWESHRASRS